MKKSYLVVYGKSIGSNFSGSAPDILGCASAGDTLEEISAMMREALESHFEMMLESGETIPEPTTTSVEFAPDDFSDVEYFAIQQLKINVPTLTNSATQTSEAHQAA